MSGLGDYVKCGWPDDDEYKENTGGGGGGGSGGGGDMTLEERLYKFRFQIPTPEKNEIQLDKPATKMILMVNGVPARVHEHELFNAKKNGLLRNPGNRYNSLCLTKNSIDKRGCPLCDIDDWAKYKGFFTVIDMGQVEFCDDGEFIIKDVTGRFNLHHRYWLNKNKEKQFVSFERLLLDAKAGSDDKPGVMRILQGKSKRMGGDLTGTVWHVTRGGKQSAKCGDEWDYMERIDIAEGASYLEKFGANPREMEDDWLESINYTKVLAPQSYEDMQYMISGARGSGDSGARSDGAEWGGGGDDIPF